jgi:DNA-binding transcriptional LysR family regulator
MRYNITLRQLRALVAVVQERSFTRAATRLGLTQSALTIAIRNLEAEIGLRLLDRTTRSVLPTPAGEAFVSAATSAIGEIERVCEDIRAQVERRSGKVAIASIGSLINEVIAPALEVLAGRYPGISVRLHEELMEGAMRRLLTGDVDFAIVTMPRQRQELEVLPLLRDRFGVVCAAAHPLAKRGRALSWAALLDHQLVALSAENGVRNLLEQREECAPALANLHHEVSSVAALLRLVEQGLGVATLPALTVAGMRPTLVYRPLSPPVHRTIFLAKRRGRTPSPAASEVGVLVLEHLTKLRSPGIEVLADASALTALGFEARR